ncbi:MAG: DNA repair protein RadA [Vampirovibrionales bacterium]|nr:DNA repair protein RadA [Vampirovibrionales bacterium]
MAKSKRFYECSDCGAVTASFLGRCPDCGAWGALVEKSVTDPAEARAMALGLSSGARTARVAAASTIALGAVTGESGARLTTGFTEIDRVLGGGLMPGSYVLLGGDPGIGKSTLMLQLAERLSPDADGILYVAGEESPFQIRQRAERLGLRVAALQLCVELNVQALAATLEAQSPTLVIVDSVQALYHPDASGAAGSVTQIKACASLLMTLAKTRNICIILIGHVTKDGAVSGPKLLEHTVDTVLYLEGDKYKTLRILRSVKNRFGATHEIGVFEMTEAGMSEMSNPSALFLSQTSRQGLPGSVIVAAIEGTRPVLVEVQALVGQTAYSTPRRLANGVELNRLHQIIAVLERRVGLDLSRHDAYVNVVGGLRLDDPAADLGVALAIVSSWRDVGVRPSLALAGEIGLTGEVRPVRMADRRIQEAARLGLRRLALPADSTLGAPADADAFELLPVANLMDALLACLPSAARPLGSARQTGYNAAHPQIP